jgi:hypothetical protein
MTSKLWPLRRTARAHSVRRRRVIGGFAGIAVAALSVFSATMPAVAATPPTLVVVIVGSGSVTSQPAGIACPAKCTTTFAAGTTVVLTPNPKGGSTFLRWGGSCTGTGACKVKVSSLTAVAAQFLAGATTTHPTPGKTLAVPGPYSGSSGQGYALSFYVGAGGSNVRNIYIQYVGVSCTPSGATAAPLVIQTVPVQPNGSFSTKTTENDVLLGNSATVILSFAGRFQAATATKPASASGNWSENIAYASGAVTSCASSEQAWTATLYREPPWQKSDIKAGSYSGATSQGYAITFTVAPGGGSVLNVSVPNVAVTCTPSGSTATPFVVPSVAVQPNGSFSTKISQTAVISGNSAKVTDTFAGYFEGPTSAAASTVAGIWREDIVIAGAATTRCSSDEQYWTANI